VTTQAEIVIDNNVILDGEGNLTIDGNDDHRVFSMLAGVTTELKGVTVSGGSQADPLSAANLGGGILNHGSLTLTESVVEWNAAEYSDVPPYTAEGGGIYNTGILAVVDSVVRDNWAQTDGCGILSTGTVTLLRSTVSDNRGGDTSGCGIASRGVLTLVDTSVQDNYASDGAEVVATGSLTMINSTVESASYFGILSGPTALLINSTVVGAEDAAISHSGGTLTLINATVVGGPGASYGAATLKLSASATVLASNSLILNYSPMYTCGPVGEVGGPPPVPITSLGGNIESPTNHCGLTDPTDLVSVPIDDVKLGLLADNGGPTETFSLLPGSVAIDRVPEAMCLDAAGDPLTTDQRGLPRPVAILGPEPKCDVGAFEVQP
jgi:hypothetical protein